MTMKHHWRRGTGQMAWQKLHQWIPKLATAASGFLPTPHTASAWLWQQQQHMQDEESVWVRWQWQKAREVICKDGTGCVDKGVKGSCGWGRSMHLYVWVIVFVIWWREAKGEKEKVPCVCVITRLGAQKGWGGGKGRVGVGEWNFILDLYRTTSCTHHIR